MATFTTLLTRGPISKLLNMVGNIIGLVLAIPIAIKLLFVGIWALISWIAGFVLIVFGYKVLSEYMTERKTRLEIELASMNAKRK